MQNYHVYCDESGIVHERYFVLGGIIFKSEDYIELDNLIKDCKKDCKIDHEIKFEKIKGHYNLKLYSDIALTLLKSNKLHFRCTIFDTQDINHNKYNSCTVKKYNAEQGFYKLYYQLLYHNFIKEDPNANYIISLDERPPHAQTEINITNLKNSLNAGCATKNNIKALKFISSDNSNFIQIADLFTGCINFAKNQKTSSKPYKQEFVDCLSNFLNVKNISKDTGKKLDWKVWNFKAFKPQS
jgi:hypothetical protein